MATNTAVCGICDLRHLSIPSTDWCPECEEALCSECKEHHSLSKSSRAHETIPIADYRKLPSFISDIQQYCGEHNDKYQLFCQTHDCPLCNMCIKTHSKCGDVMPLNEVLTNAKIPNVLEDLVQSLKDLIENIIRIRKDRQDNLTSIKNQKIKWIGEIRNVRHQINEHLDKLEEQTIKELDTVEENASVKIQRILDTLDDKEKEITEFQTVVDNIQHYASDLQIFLGTREIESKVTENEKILQSLVENNDLDQISVVCSVDTKIQDISTSVQKFGSVKIQANRSKFVLNRRKDRQAQILMTAKRQSIDDIKLTLVQSIKTGERAIRGCCLTSSGGLLFIDHSSVSKQLIFMNADGSPYYRLRLSSSMAFDITIIDDKTVAITSGNSTDKKGVSIIDLTTRREKKFVSLPGHTYGITCNGNSLICSVENQDIHIISCKDFNITIIPNSVLPDYSYVTVHDDKVYYTNSDQNTVNCRHLDGTSVWHFKDGNALKTPRGITVDNNGNVYVTGENTNNVLVISPDGKQHKQILLRDDGLSWPTALFYDKSGRRLLVANNNNGMAFLYSAS